MGTVASIVVTAIGAGVSAYSQAQAGKTQSAIANFNARQQDLQAQRELTSMRAQQAIAEQQAEQNFQLQQAEAEARFANARRLEEHALGQDAINRANLRKSREDMQRLQGEQRAAIAASGVVEASGTPLDLLAETAARIQQEQEEEHFAAEVERRQIFEAAGQERLGGQFALAGATLNRQSSLAEAGLRGAAATSRARAQRTQAQITRLTGAAAKKVGRTQAAATLFSGANSAFALANNSNFKTT